MAYTRGNNNISLVISAISSTVTIVHITEYFCAAVHAFLCCAHHYSSSVAVQWWLYSYVQGSVAQELKQLHGTAVRERKQQPSSVHLD